MTLREAVLEREQFGTPIVVRFGAGANSSAMLVGLHSQGIRPDLICFSDTGGEKPETYAHLDDVDDWLAVIGFPAIEIVRYATERGETSLEEYCLCSEFLPSRAFGLGSCADKWKVRPFEKFMTSWPPAAVSKKAGRKPFILLGYDGGEERRAKIHENERNRFLHPLIEWGWDRERCIAEIQRCGLPVPPKSACYFCPSSTKSEVLQLKREHPDLFARAVHIERVCEKNNGKVKGLGRHWSWEALAKATAEQLKLFAEVPVEACITCSDDSCDLEAA